jgi:ArsR family transcriptional regulator
MPVENFCQSDLYKIVIKFFSMVSMQTFFTALADRTRRRILNLIRDRELCVCFFTEILDVSQPKVSRHLAYLRNAEIVTARRDGKWMYYRIVQPDDLYAAQILHDTLDWLASQERMQADYEKLKFVCTSPAVPAQITRAPKPNTLHQADTSFQKDEELDTFLL